MLIPQLLVVGLLACLATAASDGEVCFNNCSGHGTCRDFVCDCFVGWHGDDCRISFLTEATRGGDVIPILGAGHFNLTRKNFTKFTSSRKRPLALVGFSSRSCHKCITHEPQYQQLAALLSPHEIPFARADADRFRDELRELGAADLPVLVVYQRGRPRVFEAAHSAPLVAAHLAKLAGPVAVPLSTAEQVLAFLDPPADEVSRPANAVVVVGFFSSADDVEEDEFDEFRDAVQEARNRAGVFVGVSTSAAVADVFKRGPHEWIDRTPSLVLYRSDVGLPGLRSLNLDTLYGDDGSVSEWIFRASVPLVDKLAPNNFAMYERLNLPMLILFLDLTDAHQLNSHGNVGGQSAGVKNDDLLAELRIVAKEHHERISFVFADGVKHADQMLALGVFGGRQRLPAAAFNTKDGRQLPFSERLPINSDTLTRFVADFLSGKLNSAADAEAAAKRALTSTRPINMKNLPVRPAKAEAPAERRGVAEQFSDSGEVSHVRQVNQSTFSRDVLDDRKDVVVLFHAAGCEACAHMNVYYKRLALRFHELHIPSLVVARMDVTDESPPASLHLQLPKLPALVMFPAADKQAPYRFFSGVGKVLEMMKWVHAEASIAFVLEDLAHLNDREKALYREQVAAREEYLAGQRRDDAAATEAEERHKAAARDRRAQRAEL